MKQFLIALALIIALVSHSCSFKQNKIASPNDLVVSEGFVNPVGFYDVQPTFSWKLPEAETVISQSAYRIVVASSPDLLPDNADIWDTKKVDSQQSTWLKYEGKPFSSRQKVYWSVMCWDQKERASKWADIAHFEMGLLKNSDWKAYWIGLEEEDRIIKTAAGTRMLKPEYYRKDFQVKDDIKKARLYITAKGVFEAHLNGSKVGDDVMAPGYTPYTKRIETLTYDVTKSLKQGENIIGIMLAEGWHSGRLGWSTKMWSHKPLPRVLGQLEIVYKNGDMDVIPTDASWTGSRKGPIRFSGIYDGEVYDANLEMPGWSTPSFESKGWLPVIAEKIEAGVALAPKRHNTVKVQKSLQTVNLSQPQKGKVIFDLGQNMVGVPQINIPVQKNQKVTIRFAEMLDRDGNIYTENYRSAISTDYYIPKEDGTIIWRPTFTFHGFRYVELSGFDADSVPEKYWVSGLVLHSEFDQSGTFSSSHKKLNQLQSNIEWGMRGNFLDIPTDCPQRDERMGWTGDAQVFAPTAMYIGDVHAFWSAWLQSMREDQDEQGGIPFVVPNPTGNTFSSGWADAATVIPWEVYFRTGDIGVLEENYQMMKKLVGYYQSKSKDHIVNVNTFGDWLQPFPLKEGNQRGDTPKDLIGTAYYARSIDMTCKAAEALGKRDDFETLKTLFENVSKAFSGKFIDKEGKLTTEFESQTGYLMALGFNLVPEDMKDKVFKQLVKQIQKADNHLRTGFLGTPLLAPVLDGFGRSDLMLSILFKETYPSWFYSINQGATTMWERWNSYSHEDGFGKSGMNSFNHYAYGAIGQWMYERIAGIAPLEPGYKKILIAPVWNGPLDHAKGTYNSVYGMIKSNWTKKEGEITLDVTIPGNTSALLKLPVEDDKDVFLNMEPVSDSDLVEILEMGTNLRTMEIGPGTYCFTIR